MLVHTLVGTAVVGTLAFLWQAYGQGEGVAGTASMLKSVMNVEGSLRYRDHDDDD